mgnify:CR=1 FL=1
MELYVNGQKLDIQLEDEKTIGDVLKSFEEECEKTQATTVNIFIDEKNISANEFDEVAKQELKDDTKIELDVVSVSAIKSAFKEQEALAVKIADELETVSVKFQSGQDKEANLIITKLADLVDAVCHTASLSALFPEEFNKIKIEDKTFSEFFADFSPILKDFEQAISSNDTVMIGDLSEYEISPRLRALAQALEM